VDGIYDLAGNVEEWVADWYSASYADGSARDPGGPPVGDRKVIRGGSFRDGQAWLRGAARDADFPSIAHAWRGFRCAHAPRW
jgi:formylglycine-generating enzyme required for sulfatase activity